MTIIPLGTRCSACYVVQRNLFLRKQSFPFDWMDIHFKNMTKFLDLDYDKVETFVRDYFSKVQSHTQRHPDGTWFPHDVFGGYDHKAMTEKYVRRFLRLHKTLLSDEDLVFLSVTVDALHGNLFDYEFIKVAIRNRFKIDPLFITANLPGEVDFVINNGRHYNFAAPFSDTKDASVDWLNWEKSIANKILSLNILQ